MYEREANPIPQKKRRERERERRIEKYRKKLFDQERCGDLDTLVGFTAL